MTQPTIIVPFRGQLLILSHSEFNAAAERGRRYLQSQPAIDDGELLGIRDVIERVGMSRSGIYLAISRGRFPAPAVRSKPGAKRRVRWRKTDVEAWMNKRAER